MAIYDWKLDGLAGQSLHQTAYPCQSCTIKRYHGLTISLITSLGDSWRTVPPAYAVATKKIHSCQLLLYFHVAAGQICAIRDLGTTMTTSCTLPGGGAPSSTCQSPSMALCRADGIEKEPGQLHCTITNRKE